jgi:hypothetical protein
LRSSSWDHRGAARAALLAAGLVLLGALFGAAARAADGEARTFGLVDLSSPRAPDGLRAEIERWAGTRGLTTLPDAGMRRALAGPESARVASVRTVNAARTKQMSGDCAGAVALATQAEAETLAVLGVDEERESLKSVYVTLILCHDKLGHASDARAAGARLRTLVSMPPAPLTQPLWDRYAATAADTAGTAPAAAPPAPGPAAAPEPVELQVDTDPPNAHVAINYHFDGVTPRTLKVPPGVVYVEVEKDGFKKAFRKVTVERTPVRVQIALAERRQDRAAEVETTVARLRGNDPGRHRTTLARLAELARVDVLVAIAVDAGIVKMWRFDADRGDLVGGPVESRLDPKTGRWVAATAASFGATN